MTGVRPADLDRLIHEPVRLGLVSLLASRRAMRFTELRDQLGVTDGNLSVHLRALETAGYVAVTKAFADRRPRTTLRLTPAGRAAFRKYVDALESIVGHGIPPVPPDSP